MPVIEVDRQGLDIVPGLGIASDGPVRSILLVSKVPLREVSSLALDRSSRTSVEMARIVLAEKYGVTPTMVTMAPHIDDMLAEADACLVIGDPALRFDPAGSERFVCDLGEAWRELTGLPMVYAVWAGRAEALGTEVSAVFQESYDFGRARVAEIVGAEAAERGIGEDLATEYLTRHIVYELGARHYDGMKLFLKSARGAV